MFLNFIFQIFRINDIQFLVILKVYFDGAVKNLRPAIIINHIKCEYYSKITSYFFLTVATNIHDQSVVLSLLLSHKPILWHNQIYESKTLNFLMIPLLNLPLMI